MKRRARPKPWTLFAVVPLLLPAIAKAADSRSRSPLVDVKELAKPVSLTETKIPLGELVQKVSAETGVRLTASPEVENEPVAVVVKDLPARELLAQLADMLDYVWSKRGKPGAIRYEIWQDLAAKNREEALREAARLDVERRVGEQVRRLAEVAALPPKEIERLDAQHQQWNDTFFKLPPAQRAAVWAKERLQAQRLSDVHLVSSPINRTLALLLDHLSPAQRLLLSQGRPLVFSTDPQPGEQLLPEAESRAFRAAHPNMDDTWRYGDPEMTERARQKQRRMEEEWAAAPGYRVTVRLDASQFDHQGWLALRAFAAPIAGKPAPGAAQPGGPLAADYDQANGTSLQLFAEPSDGPSQADTDSPERRAALAKDPLLGAVRRFKRQPDPHPRPGAPPRRSFGRLQEMLPDVARSCGLNIIADSYGADNANFPFPAEEPAPVYVLLDRITQYGYRWDKKGNLVRIRYRGWPFARPREVPYRIVRAWQARLAEGRKPSLEECAATAAALTDDQLEMLPRLIHSDDPFASMNDLSFARHALRLYAALAPAQRQALWHGQPLPVTAMTAAQRDLFLAPWRDREQERERGDPSAEPAAPSAPPLDRASRLEMSVRNMTGTAERRGETTYFHWTPAPPPSAAGAPGAAAGGAAARPGGVIQHTIAQIGFQFIYTAGDQQGEGISVAPRQGVQTPGD